MLHKFIDVDGAQTRCVVAGHKSAPPLLLIHTTFCTADMWIRNIDELGKDFFVVAVDALGHGFTRPSRDVNKVDIGTKVAHLLKLAEVLNWRTFAVGGASLGGLIAVQLFLASNGRVQKLIINGSGSCFNTEDQFIASGQRLYQRFSGNIDSLSSEDWRERLKHSFYDPAALPAELLAVLPLCYAQPWMKPFFLQTLDALRNRDEMRPYRILERLEEITADTLVVWGRDDPGAIYECAVAGVKRIPKARMVTFINCGHMPMLEHAGQYNETVRSFLKE